MVEPTTCSACGAVLSTGEEYHFEEQIYCMTCLDNITFICERCEERVSINDHYGGEYYNLCENCYYDHYVRCDSCSRVVTNDAAYYLDSDDYQDHPYCCDCYDEQNSKAFIHDYNYKPTPLFYGDGSRFYGVELEIDEGGDDQDNAKYLLGIANKTAEHLYCKRDGSINNGFEMVTQVTSQLQRLWNCSA